MDSPSAHVYRDKDSGRMKWPNRAITIARFNCACKHTKFKHASMLMLACWSKRSCALQSNHHDFESGYVIKLLCYVASYFETMILNWVHKS